MPTLQELTDAFLVTYASKGFHLAGGLVPTGIGKEFLTKHEDIAKPLGQTIGNLAGTVGGSMAGGPLLGGMAGGMAGEHLGGKTLGYDNEKPEATHHIREVTPGGGVGPSWAGAMPQADAEAWHQAMAPERRERHRVIPEKIPDFSDYANDQPPPGHAEWRAQLDHALKTDPQLAAALTAQCEQPVQNANFGPPILSVPIRAAVDPGGVDKGVRWGGRAIGGNAGLVTGGLVGARIGRQVFPGTAVGRIAGGVVGGVGGAIVGRRLGRQAGSYVTDKALKATGYQHGPLD